MLHPWDHYPEKRRGYEEHVRGAIESSRKSSQ
jgi:hypothetical protein